MKKEEKRGFPDLVEYLKRTRGIDFSGYKSTSLQRRVERRMQQIPISSFDDYIDYLEVHPDEYPQLFNTILINVTEFFRDAPAWEYLQAQIVPEILKQKKRDELIRIWSAGCASGQEAYTLAILFAEALGANAFRDRVKIYATDADDDALMQARIASYSAKEVQSVPPDLLQKYFEPTNGRFTFRNDLRRSIIFGRHDLVQDAPISRLDLLVCRNTLMYFNAETQGRILMRLHFALSDSGFLFLGKAEMMMTRSNLFSPVSLKYRVFTKVDNGNVRERIMEMAQVGDSENGNRLARQIRIREAAIDFAPVPQIVVDVNGMLVLVNERARNQFNLSVKDLGRPLQDLEISYRPVELRSLIDQAYSERRVVAMSDVQRNPPKGEMQYFDLQVVPLHVDGDAILGAIVSFIDVSQGHRLHEELRRTAQDLETAYEELQSANEELETMNEELQSSNEELHTVNEELRQRTSDFNRINAWLQSVLSIPPTALVVVDKHLNVLLWNQRAEDMWGLRAAEVTGRSLFSLDIGLPVGELRMPILACLDGQHESVTRILDAVNRRGKTIKCRVVISPFDGSSSEDAGAALVMEDVTDR